jgi:LmbE family N-acetylglucosaminyl deacetylase
MQNIYLSPHLDDVVFSCAGIIHEQLLNSDTVEIWTIFAGDPPANHPLTTFARSLHERWGVENKAVFSRRAEDRDACEYLGVSYKHLNFADCIYRRYPQTGKPVINNDEDLFKNPISKEKILIEEIYKHLNKMIPEKSRLIIPLGVGNHIDHLITRTVAEKLKNSTAYYADFPYAAVKGKEILQQVNGKLTPLKFSLSAEGLRLWQRSAAFYQTQLNSFWGSPVEMEQALLEYSKTQFGSILWEKKPISR